MSGTMGNQVDCDRFRFRGSYDILAAAAAGSSEFRKSIQNSASIEPNGGELRFELDSTNEAQAAVLHCDDILSYDIDQLQSVEFFARANYPAAEAAPEIAIGMANNGVGITDPDSLTNAIFFRLVGDGTAAGRILKGVSIIGGVTDSQDSSFVWGDSEWIHLKIDFSSYAGLPANVNSLPKSGKGAIKLLAGDPVNGGAKRELVSHQFDLSDYAGSLQPVVMLRKSAADDVATLDIREIKLTFKNQ